jgi:proline racemase
MQLSKVFTVVGCHAEGEVGNVVTGGIGDMPGDSMFDKMTRVGGIPAVTCSVAGQAYITDVSQVGLDPHDPFPQGYTLSDTWPDRTGRSHA